MASVVATTQWFATAPDFSIGQISLTQTTLKDEARNNAAFVRQIKIALSRDVAEPPTEGWVVEDDRKSTIAASSPRGKSPKVILSNIGNKTQDQWHGFAVKLVSYKP